MIFSKFGLGVIFTVEIGDSECVVEGGQDQPIGIGEP